MISQSNVKFGHLTSFHGLGQKLQVESIQTPDMQSFNIAVWYNMILLNISYATYVLQKAPKGS